LKVQSWGYTSLSAWACRRRIASFKRYRLRQAQPDIFRQAQPDNF